MRSTSSSSEEEDVDRIDEDLLRTAIFHQLSDTNKEILRALAQLDDGFGIVTLFNDDFGFTRLQIIDPKSQRAICHLTSETAMTKRELTSLVLHKLGMFHDPNLYKITDLGRKVASLSEAE